MQNISGEALSKLSLSELENLSKTLETPTNKQKEIAWQKMDTGVYDNQGNLIGDTCLEEDEYLDIPNPNKLSASELRVVLENASEIEINQMFNLMSTPTNSEYTAAYSQLNDGVYDINGMLIGEKHPND